MGAAVVASVGVLSLPLAVALDADRAWWDYGAWSLFGKGKAITFDWTHEYGPLNWSRAGATVLNVKSDRPHYWKAEVLDSFDGLRWVRSAAADDNRFGPEVAFSGSVPQGRWDYNEYNPNWDERIRFTVRSLSSTMVVGAGITMRVDGVGGARPSSDGTTRLRRGVTLEKGDSYFVRAYAPNPTKAQMEGVQEGYPGGSSGTRRSSCPTRARPRPRALSATARAPRRRVAATTSSCLCGVIPRADGARARRRAIRRSPYGRMYDLAQRLTADQPTAYAAVKNVERYLQDNVHLLRASAHTADPADGLPLPGRARLLPAVLWRHGADAADGRHPRPRGRRLLPGLVQQGHAASTASATSTRTRGSRSGSPASAGSRSTRRRRARRRSRSPVLSPRAQLPPTRARCASAKAWRPRIA